MGFYGIPEREWLTFAPDQTGINGADERLATSRVTDTASLGFHEGRVKN